MDTNVLEEPVACVLRVER